jgi:cell division protein FtsL
MNKRQEHTLVRRFFASRMFLIVAFIIAVLFALGYARAYYQDYKIKQEIRLLQEEIKGLEKKKLESMEILKYVISQEFVEEKARTELNMKLPGEKVMVIDGLIEHKEERQNEAVENQGLSNQAKWWYYFTQNEVTEFNK